MRSSRAAANRFDLGGTLTRAMTAAILYRMEGKPETAYAGSFGDVPEGAWYTDAVEWGAVNGILTGYGDGTFGPSDPVTGEQLAVILHRAAALRGDDVSVPAGSVEGVSSWAEEAVRWAAAEGICGNEGNFRDAINRAEAAEAFRAYRTPVTNNPA